MEGKRKAGRPFGTGVSNQRKQREIRATAREAEAIKRFRKLVIKAPVECAAVLSELEKKLGLVAE